MCALFDIYGVKAIILSVVNLVLIKTLCVF